MNELVVIGYAGRDPEMRYTPAGKAVCDLSLGVDDGKDPETGERRTLWVKVVCWDKTAELAAEYVRKGHRVAVSGRAGVESYTSREGEPRANLTLTANRVEFLTSRAEAESMASGAASARPAQQRPSTAPTAAATARPSDGSDLDDLPF